MKLTENGIQEMRFLIDSSTSIFIIPGSRIDICKKVESNLYAANHTVIPTYGIKIIELDLGFRRNFRWSFIIAKLDTPIIGTYFLIKFN